MKITDLTEDKKIYLIHLSNRNTYKVNGVEKDAILNSDTQFIQLPDGSVINRSFIIDITLDRELTKDNYKKLPQKT
jgi:hypothetical protein